MNDTELRALVERMIADLAGQAPTPQVKSADYKPMEPEGAVRTANAAADLSAALPDITQVDIRRQYLVEQPKNGPAYLDL